jgi:endonuclease/exonuclease/phosphatase family metal-dependent hydrolase
MWTFGRLKGLRTGCDRMKIKDLSEISRKLCLLAFRSITVCVLVLCSLPVFLYANDTGISRTLTYSEIADLYSRARLSPNLEIRLNSILTEPFVSNTAIPTVPSIATSPKLGEYIRIAHWNIQRGLEFGALQAVFESEERIAALLDPVKFPPGSSARKELFEQAAILRSADVIVLNEVDWGLKRSDYRNITEELAAQLGWNYAFGVEFVELSPVQRSLNSGTVSDAINLSEQIDIDRYKGLHGTAILSRFPLENVRLLPFRNQPYDWFESEMKGISLIEKGKRKLVKEVFLEKAFKEVRRGGRMMLIAEITDPRFPAGRVTVVATHLESRTSPAKRQVQLRELLETIKPIRTPVIVAGDMNTSTTDMTPTTIGRELRKRFGKPEYWVKTGINQVLGLGMLNDAISATLTFGRNYSDPTVRHIPIFMPNEEKKFFSLLKSFRFDDGGAFDFRGEASRSFGGRRNTLANSNERDGKGFVTTFRLPRPVKFIGKFKLDWILVKPVHLFDPSDYRGSYLFAPHFGRTLGAVNSVVESRISDHSPLIVDLPLGEPAIEKSPAIR